MKIHVKESISISAPQEKVHAVITDFHSWQHWSPWLLAEPDAKVEITPDGSRYSWEGNLVGVGTMLFDTIKENQVTIDLTFLKPWKSKAKVTFNLSSKADETTVEWVMDSQLPFFLFWMKKSMQAYIGMDYTRGLTMLKDYIELGAVPFSITVDGFKERNSALFIGKHGQCTMEEVGQRVSADFQALMPYLYQHHKSLLIYHGFTMYSKWDVVKNNVIYTVGHPVSTLPETVEEQFITGTLQGAKVHSVTYTGPYRHVGNAWAVQMTYLQNKRFKSPKHIPPTEFYHNSPVDTPENDLITQVQFAVK